MSLENTERQPLLADPHNTTLRSKYMLYYTILSFESTYLLQTFESNNF